MDHRDDIDGATMEFDDWCTANIKPWFADHQYVDTERVRRWSGADVDLEPPVAVGSDRCGGRG